MIKIESNKEYHSNLEAVSKSRLERFSKSPQWFKWCEEHPPETTDDLVEGSAFHKLVLEPQDFAKEYAILPPCDRRTKDGKATYESFLLESNGLQIITQEQYNMICGMRDSVMSNKYARVILQGEVEQSYYWTDDLTQELCKCRPDVLRPINDRILITDLKSCRSADTESFTRDVVKFGYDLQSAMYREGVSKVLEKDISLIDFVFVAVEKKPPYLINILQASSLVLERGNSLFRHYLGQYAECKKTGNWYGYNGFSGGVNNLSLPAYLLKDID